MTKEDYVSFEIAKLLKEKGFDVPTENFYDNTGENLKDSKTIYGRTPDFREINWNADPFVCEGFPKLITFSRPSQSIALKWLREVHNIDIIAPPQFDNVEWTYSPIIFKLSIPCTEIRLNDNKHKKELAVEAALLYVLKNLI